MQKSLIFSLFFQIISLKVFRRRLSEDDLIKNFFNSQVCIYQIYEEPRSSSYELELLEAAGNESDVRLGIFGQLRQEID